MPVFNNMLAGASGGAGAGYEIERSLRFNSSDSAHLSRTPSSAGNRRTWTWSGWVKRSKDSSAAKNDFFGVGGNGFMLGFDNGTQDVLRIEDNFYTGGLTAKTVAVFRDYSAWYHIVLSIDTTQASSANGIRLWVNNELQTLTSVAYTQNYETLINSTTVQFIGGNSAWSSRDFNGYLADVHFIDGQALAPTDFGAPDDNGVWQPKKFNSFNNLNNGTTWSSAVPTADGFRPGRAAADGFDGSLSTYVAINNTTFNLNVGSWNLTGAVEVYTGSNMQYAVDGGSASNMTADGWTSVGQAGSITTLTFTRSDSGYPYFYAVRVGGYVLIDGAGDNSFHLDFADNSSKDALGTDTSGNSNTWTVNNLVNVLNTKPYSAGWSASSGFYGDNIQARIFDGDISGNSFGLTLGNTLTWSPSFDVSTGSSFRLYTYPSGNYTSGYTISVGSTSQTVTFSATSAQWVNLTSLTGLTINSSNNLTITVASGSSRVGVSALEIDGQILISNENGGIIDSLRDSPVNGDTASDTGLGGEIVGNYAVLNPLVQFGSNNQAGTLSNGNLDWTTSSTNYFANAVSTIAAKTGKYYVETVCQNASNSGIGFVNAASTNSITGNYGLGAPSDGWLRQSTVVNNNNSNAVTGMATLAVGDIIGLALDLDNGKAWWSKNGVFHNSGNPTNGTNATVTFTPGDKDWLIGVSLVSPTAPQSINFGQRAFAYTAPSGYKSLNTANLEPPTIADPSKYFDTKLWNGNGGTQAITGLNFSPDFAWVKHRNSSSIGHILYDAVRGAGSLKGMNSNLTRAEGSCFDDASNHGYVSSFDANGFTVVDGNSSSTNYTNQNNIPYVGWAWDAGDDANPTTIAAGGLNSSTYNQDTSTVYTNQITGVDYSWAGSATNGMFDGKSDTVRAAGSSSSFTWNTSIAVNTLRIKVHNEGGAAGQGGTFTVTDSSGTRSFSVPNSSNADVTNGTLQFTNVPVSGTLTQIVCNGGSGGYQSGIAMVEIDGKILVDYGVAVPNVPSIASTVRANPSAGFSIVSWTGNSTAGATLGHSLSAAPKMIIVKNRSRGTYGDWVIGHDAINGFQDGNQLYFTNAGVASGEGFFNNTSPTSSVFTVKNNYQVNYAGDNYIAYCFAPVEGYSKFGVFTSSTGGVFQHCGFAPRFILFKSTGTGSWAIHDAARNNFGSYLLPDTSGAEGNNSDFTVTSQGFKFDNNSNGSQFLFAAFATHPFKTARAQIN